MDVRWFGTPLPAPADRAARLLWSAGGGEPAHVRYVERPALLAELARQLSGPVDLVHLHGWGTARLWNRLAGVPALHVAVDSWSVNAGNRRRGRMQRLGERRQSARITTHERRHYPHLGAVVTVAEPDADAVRRVAPTARVIVVPNGVEAGEPSAARSPAPVLGFHGSYDSQANVEAAVGLVTEILPRVRDRVPGASVLLVGRHPPGEVRRLAGPSVVVRGDVDDVRPELSGMAVHVDWMTSGSGIKNKVLEAMAAGLPVVGSAAAAAGIGAGPGLTVAADPAGVADAVVRLLADPATRLAAGAVGRERVVSGFGWERNVAAIEALWSELATGGGS
jgi:glycosyltransferase involved in cell wall biosynthesis